MVEKESWQVEWTYIHVVVPWYKPEFLLKILSAPHDSEIQTISESYWSL